MSPTQSAWRSLPAKDGSSLSDPLLHVQMVDACRSIGITVFNSHGARCCGPDRGPKPRNAKRHVTVRAVTASVPLLQRQASPGGPPLQKAGFGGGGGLHQTAGFDARRSEFGVAVPLAVTPTSAPCLDGFVVQATAQQDVVQQAQSAN